jgi:hypothetical protein
MEKNSDPGKHFGSTTLLLSGPGTYIRRAVAQSSQLELQAADFVLLLPISLTLGAQLGAHS